RIKAAAYERGVRGAKRLPGTVVSVGNITAGGTGKTPMVIWLAGELAGEGEKVGVLTRGYRGSSHNGLPQSDEVAILRSRLGESVPIAVGADRFASGMKLAGSGVDHFVLDDGFQHLQLARDADIVMIDASDPFGGGRCLPAGRLREPVSALDRADLIVITRAERAPAVETRVRRHTGAPIFYAVTELRDVVRLSGANRLAEVAPAEWRALKFFAFCGIGNAAAFFTDLRAWGFNVKETEAYPDHYRYEQMDATELEARCRANEADALICTEKDIFNLREVQFSAAPVFVARISLRVIDAKGFSMALRGVLESKRTGAAM
ncbi:MAG TPA: tetraacyldisaccharide 4'-kinase, partial [Candidatus Acidoferrales bacterium]|nr:tetraacyldisaccharide 4'-kinase [Candidatus Acidoferrales bacterium]